MTSTRGFGTREQIRLVDLTQPLSPLTPRSVDHPQVAFTGIRWFSRHGLRASVVTASVHSGTHVDAPAVYVPGGANIDEIMLDRLFGPGVVLGVPRDEWGVIDESSLRSASPSIEPGDIVVLVTGWHKYYLSDEEKYMLRFPGLTKTAVDWLVEKRVSIVCADTPSAEHIFMRIGQWRDVRRDVFADVKVSESEFPPAYAHKQFLRNGILMCDHIGGDVDQVVGRRCLLGVFPMKYSGVEGAPARVVAFVNAE